MMRGKIFSLLGILVSLNGECVKRHHIEYQRAFTYRIKADDTKEDLDRAIDLLASLNVNYLVLVVELREDKNSPLIYRDSKVTPEDTIVKYAIESAHSFKMKTVLKPHIRYGKEWCANIKFSDESHWERWARSYKDWIKHYSLLSEENKVEGLVIGAELCGTSHREEMWREIIESARERFSGFLTYSAHPVEYQRIKFWDALDYIGLAPYFSLSSSKNPTLAQLKARWDYWLNKIEDWQKEIDKPVLFTEIGFPSVDGASMRPWAWTPVLANKVDYEEQALCYEATFEACKERSWLYGIYWWVYELNDPSGFTPLNKPAEEVIRRWYK